MRIDRPDDGDPVPATPDAPELRQAGAGAGKGPQASHDAPPEPAGAATRTERALQSRATVDAAYRVADAVDQAYARVEKLESAVITPAMRLIEADDPGRYLAGLEHRLKERYRIAEKVNHDIEKRGVAPAAAFAAVKDTIRYTYVYPDNQYSNGAVADCERIKAAGFELIDSRNWWPHDEYKGLNSWWRVPDNGQLFEVQFHTQASLDAKEETHAAYERLRTLPRDHAEVRDLRAFQREVTSTIPIPPRALDITLLGASDADKNHLLRNRGCLQQPREPRRGPETGGGR